MELSLDILRRPDVSWADKIAYLGYEIRQRAGSVNEMPVRHLFRKGEYIREVVLPAGIVFIGKVHRQGHVVELLHGEVELITEQGATLHKGPDSMTTAPGFQTVFRTITPIVGRTIHPNPGELRDINVLEAEIFEPENLISERGKRIAQELLE
jgi:hypothetical protein